LRRSPASTIRFAAVLSLVCSILVAGSAVVLRDRQEANRLLDRRLKVLTVAQLVAPGERLSREEVDARFEARIRPVAIELATGEAAPEIDIASYDQRRAAQDPGRSRLAPPNDAGVARLPVHAVVYEWVEAGAVAGIILPIEGKGLWSTLYGYLALTPDTREVRGIDFYEHGETAGLGDGIEDPVWRARWEGRQAFDDNWEPRIEVVKGPAPPPSAAPFEVDGLAGATLTGRGVTHLVRFWLGWDGFGPYLARVREGTGAP
jgi:Na+-transporting NADH:ubiquinone oxidoreductase subunit C